MLRVPVKYVDPLNIVLIILTCALAHILPYRLLVFSYAILGPAHYLTQISWLHDRRYFANAPWLAPVLGLLAFSLTVAFFYTGENHDTLAFGAIVLSVAVWFALMTTLPSGNDILRGTAVAAGILLIFLITHSPVTTLFIAVMLPTVMHVFVFTAAFMWAGAMKSHKKSAYAAVIALLVGAASFLIPAASTDALYHPEGIIFFQPVVDFMQGMLRLPATAEAQLFGFLAYAYTYHYLNWFSKAEVIHWDRIPRERMLAIVVIYATALGIYAYNYAAGFLVILFLSYAHVLLEFPLNLRTFAAIARGKG